MTLSTRNVQHGHYIMPHERMRYADLFAANTRMNEVVTSVMEGYFGSMLVDSTEKSTVGRLDCSIFSFFGGNPDLPEATSLIPQLPGTYIMVFPRASRWPDLIHQHYTGNPPEDGKLSINRYFDFSWKELDIECLEGLAAGPLPKGLELSWVGPAEAKMMETQQTPDDNFACLPTTFFSAEDFVGRSFGFCIKTKERVVARCVAFTVSSTGINLDIETHPRFQHQGLATVVSAAMVRYCLQKGINPAWHAVNTTSARLAEKLGYVPVDYYETLMLAKGVHDPSWDIPYEPSLPLSRFSFSL